MDIVNAVQADILELLARFKFLTISLIQPIVGKSITYIRAQLHSLTEKGYIAFFRLDKPGKAEHLYYLTPVGKELLIQFSKSFADDIKLPIGTPLIVRDFSHRVKYISVTIALYYYLQSQGIEVTHMASYFDKTGDNKKHANLQAETKLLIGGGFYIPDGIVLTECDGHRKIFLVEMYCDTSTGRVLEQLQKHMLAVAEGSPGRTFGLSANPFILCVFEHASILRNIIGKLNHDAAFEAFAEVFFFADLLAVQQQPGKAFVTIHNKPLDFLN